MSLFNFSDKRLLKFVEDSDPITDMGIGDPIRKWLNSMDIEVQKIDTKDKIHIITGDINLTKKLKNPDEELPKYEVIGNFWIDNNELTCLKGICPIEVTGSFSCTNNPLESLEGLPVVKGNCWIV
jgi:hypothetical protein